MPSSCSKRPKLNATSDNDNASAAKMNAGAAVADRKEVNLSSRTIANADDNIVAEDQLFCEHNDPSIYAMNNQLIASMLGFLNYRDIMRSRICCSKFRDAAKSTIVPWANDTWKRKCETKVTVKSVNSYKAMVVMSKALPNLQQLDILDIGKKDDIKYRDGVDPDEEQATRTASWTVYDIRMISNFRELRELNIRSNRLNGRYPCLFEFPLLQVLRIDCKYLKWDLSELGGLPLLKRLSLWGNCDKYSTGSIKSLSVLNDTLEQVMLRGSEIKGDIMDLANFPHLNHLDLYACPKVTGDLRDIKDGDFLALKTISLSASIIGSRVYQFHSISEVPSVMEAIYRLSQRETPFIQNINDHYLYLSNVSSDRYDSDDKERYPDPPFFISFIQAGPRVGWRWNTRRRSGRVLNSCEVNWLDPEPSRDSSDYDDYIEKLESIEEEIFCYKGFYQPPTEEEYKRLCKEFYDI